MEAISAKLGEIQFSREIHTRVEIPESRGKSKKANKWPHVRTRDPLKAQAPSRSKTKQHTISFSEKNGLKDDFLLFFCNLFLISCLVWSGLVWSGLVWSGL